jgi:hypothetical protein
MFLLIYVDDIIVESSSDAAITILVKDINDNFATKDLGDLHYSLGIEVKKTKDELLLTQQKYATDLLEKLGMRVCKAGPLHCLLQILCHLLMKIPLVMRIVQIIVALLEVCNILHLQGLIFLSQSIKYVSSYMLPPQFIGLLLKELYVMEILLILALLSSLHHLHS